MTQDEDGGIIMSILFMIFVLRSISFLRLSDFMLLSVFSPFSQVCDILDDNSLFYK